ncbi:ATP-binding protein [Salarchaeum japonicum]|uniref:ATP-binding protein n=1 Tax=Salarchaeum japonicum TaxID=555573 RepID=A0AAV3T1Q9_9EURY|nr:DUF87 domain-containing protein [Salarchaeum japonicum]
MYVLGRSDETAGPVLPVGRFRAPDGSHGTRVGVDANAPHAAMVVGKRGSGKTYTLGVLAEALARTDGVTPVVLDPMRAFATLPDAVPATVVQPRIPASALPPRAWCDVLSLPPHTPAGALLWQAAAESETLDAMTRFLDASGAPGGRAARNALALADAWSVFDADGTDVLDPDRATVLDCAGLPRPALAAVTRAVTDTVYAAAIAGDIDALPWVLVDEAHAVTDTAAWPGLRRLLTRGRKPGVSTVLATQRPGALPPAAVSQADLLVAHRLTARDDIDALETASPTYFESALADALPRTPGDALVVDDTGETAHDITVRERDAPHGGRSRTVT